MIKYPKLKIYSTLEDLSNDAKNIFIDLLKTNGGNTFIVPGGKTPELFYQKLASEVKNWDTIALVLSDERVVDQNSKNSNYKMINKNLLQSIRGSCKPVIMPKIKNIFLGSLLESFNDFYKSVKPPKAAFLGIGADGHTASLFSGIEDKFNAIDPYFLLTRPNENFSRISISANILMHIPNIIFLISGSSKKRIVKRLRDGSYKTGKLPYEMIIRQAKGKVIVLCDEESAAS